MASFDQFWIETLSHTHLSTPARTHIHLTKVNEHWTRYKTLCLHFTQIKYIYKKRNNINSNKSNSNQLELLIVAAFLILILIFLAIV